MKKIFRAGRNARVTLSQEVRSSMGDAPASGQLSSRNARLASREACRRAAVTQRPSRMSHECPARLWRAVRGQGSLPLARAAQARCRAAVASQPIGFSRAALRACGAQSGVKDHCPLREPRGPSPSGGNFAAYRLFSSSPARHRRAVRGAGVLPLLLRSQGR